MKITHCKLSKKEQAKQLELFVLEVTARSAADLLGIQVNTAALFYHKIWQVILVNLELQVEEFLVARSSWTRAILVVRARANGGVAQPEKLWYLAC